MFVEREKARQLKAKKEEEKKLASKKFINLDLHRKQFNGVIVGSDRLIS